MRRANLIATVGSLVLILGLLGFIFAIQPPRYSPDYSVSRLKGHQPDLVTRTAWRTIMIYKIPGPPAEIGPQLVAEVQKQKPNWKIERRHGMYQIEDQTEKERGSREGVHIAAGSTDVTYVQIVSPLYKPTFLQRWWSNLREPR